jgi:hypothetical protein
MKFTVKVGVVFLFFLLVMNFCMWNTPQVLGRLPFEDDAVRVDVYVVALAGVGTSGVGNVSRTVSGIENAVKCVITENFTVVSVCTEPGYSRYLNVSRYIRYAWGGDVYWTRIRTEFPVNATLHMVNDWETYRDVVEKGDECVVINVHGEVLPVPVRYSREGWVDKIAEAMLHRNVTWVHVGGYPFRYAWRQGANDKELWGEAGFQQLMQHINKGDVTISVPSDYENKARLTGLAEASFRDTWQAIYETKAVSVDYPLLTYNFNDCIARPIWCENDYYLGGIFSFKKSIDSVSHGFYVYIGTNQTFRVGESEWALTDSDFNRGYIGCAAGLWSLVSRTARETLIGEAEAAIRKAEAEERTSGLDEACGFLDNAKHWNRLYADFEFLREVYYAMVAAEEAEKPEANPLQVLLVGLGVAFAVGSIAVVWHRKGRENNGRE